VTVNNSTNINKTNNYLSHLLIERQKGHHDVWCWISRSWLRTAAKIWWC